TTAIAAEIVQCLSCSGDERRYRVNIDRFRGWAIAIQRRVVAALLAGITSIDFEHVEKARAVLLGDAKSASLPDGIDLTLDPASSELLLKRRPLQRPEPKS